MRAAHRRPAGLHEGIREVWEDETLALFMNFRRKQGGPDYELLERRERPDRVLRPKGGGPAVGVEISRAVEEDDARLGKAAYLLGHAMDEVLAPYCKGGKAWLYAGDFPALDPKAIDALAAHLASDLRRERTVSLFKASLRGDSWKHASSYWRFDPDPDAQGWEFHSNGISQPQRVQLAPERFLVLLLSRLRDKCAKGPGYEWPGPLFLLVRNPYREYVPAQAARAEVALALTDSPFAEVWLVNYRQGTLELAPPPSTIVRLA